MPRISFRPIAEGDMPLMHQWLSAGAARRWYARRDQTPEEVAERYLPVARGERPTRGFLMVLDDAPIGYIQTYLIGDYPDYAEHVQVDDDAAGVDLFIGEAEYVGKGLGTVLLAAFLREVAFADPRVGCVVMGPEPENAAAIRCYEKVGLRHFKTVGMPGDDPPEYLMRVGRGELI